MSRLVDRLRRRITGAGTASLTEGERRVLDSPLFDEEWYAGQAGAQPDRITAVRHYVAVGVAAGHQPHPLFDPLFVRAHWSPERLARLGDGDPLELYLRRSLFGTPTHPLFDTARYLEHVPEALTHPGGPVAHYVEVGASAGVPANDWLPPGLDLREWIAERGAERARRSSQTRTAPEPARAAADPPAVSVLVRSGAADRAIAGAVASVLAHTRGLVIETVVAGEDADATQAAVLDSLPLRFPGVQVLHDPDADLLVRARGAVVVLLHPSASASGDWLTPALRVLEDPAVAAVQPLLLRTGGAIWSAGVVSPGDRGYRLLEGFPAEDARGLAGKDLPGLSGEVIVVRREVASAGTATEGRLRLLPQAPVTLAPPPVVAAPPFVAEGAREEALWDAAGFRVRGRGADGAPLVERARRVQVDESAPRLRWAIKNPALSGPAGDGWGDTHFADALARALRASGQEVVVDRRSEHHRTSAEHDDVALALRGRVRYRPVEGRLTLGWVISHPDKVTAEEAVGFDRLLAASGVWAARRSREWGIPIEPLLQATDPRLFHPDRAEPGSGHPLLFVGSERGGHRLLIDWAVSAGLPVTVYGGGWEGRLPPGMLAGRYLPNEELGAAYRAAGIVLNDHWEDMRVEGFISNRLFDAVASGARVISDDVPGLRDVFGASVQVADTAQELVSLSSAPDPDAVFGDDAARREAAADVHRDHSFDRRAEQLVRIAATELARRRS